MQRVKSRCAVLPVLNYTNRFMRHQQMPRTHLIIRLQLFVSAIKRVPIGLKGDLYSRCVDLKIEIARHVSILAYSDSG